MPFCKNEEFYFRVNRKGAKGARLGLRDCPTN
jgi:hypothetical protein